MAGLTVIRLPIEAAGSGNHGHCVKHVSTMLTSTLAGMIVNALGTKCVDAEDETQALSGEFVLFFVC